MKLEGYRHAIVGANSCTKRLGSRSLLCNISEKLDEHIIVLQKVDK